MIAQVSFDILNELLKIYIAMLVKHCIAVFAMSQIHLTLQEHKC